MKHILGFIAVFMCLLIAGTSAWADTAGPNFAGTGANVTGIGTVAWSGTGNIGANDNAVAIVTLTASTSNYLRGTNFGFSIPPYATIQGIQLTLGRYRESGFGNEMYDVEVRLVKNGTIAGDNKALTGSNWPNSETVVNYGGASDLWGTTWTPDDINATNFGAALSVQTPDAGIDAYVDYMQITVTYSIPTFQNVFRSRQTGNWNDGETWEQYDGSNWWNTPSYPAGSTSGFPVVAATATSAKTTTTSEVHTISLPSNIQSGDLILVFYSDGSTSNTNPTLPAGYTALYLNETGSTSPNDAYRAAWYRIADGTEGASVATTNAFGERSAHVTYRIAAGSYTGTPFVSTADNGTDNSPNPPSLSPSPGTQKYLWLAVVHAVEVNTFTIPSGYGSALSIGTTSSSTDQAQAQMITSQQILETGTENPGSFSLGGNAVHAAYTLAIQGAGSASSVTIQGHTVTINTNPTVVDFTVNLGATLNAGTSTVTVTGNWTNNAGVGFNAGTSTFIMGGTTLQTMSGSTFYNLEIDNPDSVELLTSETVSNQLKLTNGKVITNSDSIIVTNGSTTSIEITNGSINGNLRRAIDAAAGTYMLTDANTYMVLDGSQAAQHVKFTVNHFRWPEPIANQAAAIRRFYEIEVSSPFNADELHLSYNPTTENENGIPLLNLGFFRLRPGSTSWEKLGGSGSDGHIFEFFVDMLSTRFAIGDVLQALPVQLASFTGAVVNNNSVRLDWRTISEVNNYGFYVQRRNFGTTEWTEIPGSFVPGGGTTNEPRNYTYTDNTGITTATQYRLKQVDLDNTVHYSEPILVDLPTSVPEVAPKVFALSQNYPNPFNPSTEIKFTVEVTGHATLDVYNALGQKVATLYDGVAEAGQFNRVQFNASGLSSGVYFYRLQSGEKSDLKKLMLLK